ncbi:MAG TPA: hypothetical protein VFH77_02580 [Streptomyces sp.]|nr:hypothetical protein [Streptomyces sp.]
MTPYDRLLLEEFPDGTFGGNRPPRDPLATHPVIAKLRRLELAQALGLDHDDTETHLTAVPDQPQPAQPKEHAA